MTEKQRLDYIDCALRINNIKLSEEVLKTVIACIDLVDKLKGKATLDQCLSLNKKICSELKKRN